MFHVLVVCGGVCFLFLFSQSHGAVCLFVSLFLFGLFLLVMDLQS